jgi:colanic acid/amylovoran biosynthesis glycosyltransferase
VTSTFPQLSETFLVSKFIGLISMGWDVFMVCNTSNKDQWVYYPNLDNADFRKRVYKTWPHRPRWLVILLFPFAFVNCLLRNPVGSFRYLLKAIKRFGFIAALRRFYLDATIIALHPDLIHFEFGSLAIEQADLGDLLSCKLIVSFRGYDLNFAGLDEPEYYCQVWKYADGIHILGQDLWKRALSRGCPSDLLHVIIPPAIAIENFSPIEKRYAQLGADKAPLRILCVGRLEWKKGYEYALQAVRILLNENIKCELRIVGAGAYYESLSFARHQLELDRNVDFLGGLPHVQVLDQLNWADVFLHAAVSEGFCNAVLEAQAMQVPIVCSDADGLPENVLDAQTGFVVPRRDPAALADKLKLFARDLGLRKAFGIAGRNRVEKEFQLTSQLKQLDDFYRSLLIK